MPTNLWLNYAGLLGASIGFLVSMFLDWKGLAVLNFALVAANYFIILQEHKSDRS